MTTYTLTLESKSPKVKIEIYNFSMGIRGILEKIHKNRNRIKKNKIEISLMEIKTFIGKESTKNIFIPKQTNLLLQIASDYFEFLHEKLMAIRKIKEDEIVIFTTGNPTWVDTDIIEALRRPCNKTTKVKKIKKSDLIEESKLHSKRGIYRIEKRANEQ
jgi:hypothetical protein